MLPAALLACGHGAPSRTADALARARDELSALWSFYRHAHVEGGRVVARDEGGITTSEGQAYAMLRAVWAGDRAGFEEVWRWTSANLQVREDRLLAWRWKDRVLDRNAATDADQDAALALVLASRRFGEPRFLDEARGAARATSGSRRSSGGGRPFPTGGNWAPAERYPTIHVAYLAPYAYEVFAAVDPGRPWKDLVRSSYDLLRFLYVDRGVALPPELVYLDPRTGAILLERPGGGGPAASGYDAVPIFWRVALDASWFGRRGEADVRERMLRFPRDAWRAEGRLRDRATTAGRPLSSLDGLPLLASVQALARVGGPRARGGPARGEARAALRARPSRGSRRPITSTTGSGSAAPSSSGSCAATTSRSRSCRCSTGRRSASASPGSPSRRARARAARAPAGLGPRRPRSRSRSPSRSGTSAGAPRRR